MPIDNQSLQHYLDCFYKPNYEAISEEEIYKWSAMQRFKSIRFLDGWFDSAEPFYSRFVDAIGSLDNLLNGERFYAKKCLLDCAKHHPIETKKALSDLNYNGREIKNALPAMDAFENEMRRLMATIDDKEIYLKSFTGYRAAALFLFFMYPETYFFYKSNEYHEIKKLIDYKPSPGLTDYENCQIMSKEILEQIKKDRDLCACYEDRRKQYSEIDPEYHLLVQDILWSSTYYKNYNGGRVPHDYEKADTAQRIEIIPNPSCLTPSVELAPRKDTDYEYLQQRNTELGLDGELYVMRYEEERLKRLFPDDASKRPRHDSVVKGDGLGYDIRSFDENGKPIYIEVKTTSKSYDTPFYITDEERIRSSVEKQQFRLYRVYNFKDGSGDIGITAGSMEKYCKRAVAYKVILTK